MQPKTRKILAVIGDSSSGKKTFVNYIQKKYAFDIYDYTTFLPGQNVLSNENFASSQLKEIIQDMTKMHIAFYPTVTLKDVNMLKSKAAFNLIYVSAPAKIRYKNFTKKFPGKSFEDFLEADNSISSNHVHNIIKSKANYTIYNSGTLDEFYAKIEKLISSLEVFRPDWDDYFMSVAHEVEQRCNCIKSKVGAVIVKDNRIVSVGYNGTSSKIKNCFLGNCDRCWSNLKSGEALDKCICIHAEENALLEAGRKKSQGSRIYCTVYPCLTCAKNIIQCGIVEVIYDIEYNSELTKKIFDEAGITVRKWERKIQNVI